MSRTRSDRRKLSSKYSFFREGERHSLSANQYWIAIRDGYLVQSNYDERTAFVSDRYKAIFNSEENKWEFVLAWITPVKIRTMAELIMRWAIYRGTPNSWREPIIRAQRLQKPKENHPVVFYEVIND